MRFHTYILFIVVSAVLMACKEDIKKGEKSQKKGLVLMSSPAGSFSALPHLFSKNDVTLLSWIETQGDSLSTFKYAKWAHNAWTKPTTIMSASDWFVNWADYPMIAENNANLWSHVLKKSLGGTYSYDVKMNVKPVEQTEWTTNLPLHTDGTATEHGFVSVVPYKDSFFVNWLDGRNTEVNEAGERGAMTLRAAVVSAHGEVSEEEELDARTCDCCQTSAAITTNGPVVVYRSRTKEEIRDISIVRQMEGKWTAPKSIHADNWKIKGCPVNGPRIAAHANTVAVAWFTGQGKKPRVQVAFSNNGGERFQKALVVASGKVLGRVDVVLLDEANAIVSWMEREGETTFLKAAKVNATGILQKPMNITQMKESRRSGFPQMELVQDKLFFVCTAIHKDTTMLQTGFVAISEF